MKPGAKYLDCSQILGYIDPVHRVEVMLILQYLFSLVTFISKYSACVAMLLCINRGRTMCTKENKPALV